MRGRVVQLRFHLLVWLIAAVILLGTFVTGIAIWSMRSAAIDDAIKDSRNVATVLSQQMASSVQSIEIVLYELQDRLDRAGVTTTDDFAQIVSTEATHKFLTDRLSRLPQAEVITFADHNGQIINFTRSWPIPPIDLAGRDYFQYAKANAGDKLYVSIPVSNKVTGTKTIYFSKRITGVNGDFLGIALVGVGLDYFRNVYHAISLLPETTFLFLRTDGTTLLRYPGASHSGEKMPPNSPWYRQVANGGGNYRSPGIFDHMARLVAIQPLKGYPLVVNVAITEEAALRVWHWRAITIGAGAAATFLCLSVLLTILLSQYNNLRRSEEALATRSRDLEKANSKVDAAVNNMTHGICMFDAEKLLVVCNELYAKTYRLPSELLKCGTPHSEIIAHRVRNGILKGDSGDAAVQRQLSKLSALSANETSIRIDEHADGKLIRVVRKPMKGGGWVATHEDITEEYRAEQALDETKRFLDSIIQNIPVAVIVKDVRTRRFALANRAYEAWVGMSQAELMDKTVFDIYGCKEAGIVDKLDSEALEDSTAVSCKEIEVLIPMRGTRVLATKRIIVRDAQGAPKYIVVVIDDVTERKQSEQRIVYMAHHDALTGLANRAALVQKIVEAAARLRRRSEPFSVLLLDLDRFKAVNDTLGHPSGDALLRDVAKRLKALLRETDVLSRLGGDEFAIVQAGDTNQRAAAQALAGRIIEMFDKAFDVEGNEIHIGTSIGIALAPEHGTNSEELLKMADLALYRAKSAGRNNFQFFDSEMVENANTRQAIESDLRRAIRQDELELHYQPIVDSKTRKISSVEALIRWRHPTKGVIPPDQFIPLAEETNLINEIGEWVLHTACTDAASWPSHIKVAVNLSPVQFRNQNFPDAVMSALALSGLAAERLELEITETALMESASECLSALQQFKALGIAVALDDFCTGYSSLSQLTVFPFDKIKIDKSFVQSIGKRTDCTAIISATLTLAKSLDIATTAEGVETAEQYRLLRLIGVTSLQGHLFKRPCRASEIDFECVYSDPRIENAA